MGQTQSSTADIIAETNTKGRGTAFIAAGAVVRFAA
jgi:hypothetical protein